MRTRPSAELGLLAAACAVAVAVLAGSAGAPAADSPEATPPAGWQGLLGDRPLPQLGQRQLVLLRAPSLADRVRAAGGVADEETMRRWTRTARGAQERLLTRLAFRGAPISPEHEYVRVLNGFSASLDPRALQLLERDAAVVGVYPVRAAYPATVSAVATSGRGAARTGVHLPGFDGRGVTVALLDTGVDLTHPFVRGRLRKGIDVLDPVGDASAQADPGAPGRLERHGTELAGIVGGSRGPAGLTGVAPGVSIIPIRVAGWQPDAVGGVAVYSRTDQLLAGLEAAVDPDGNGDALDAARVALVGVVEPYAAFPSGPLAVAVGGAETLGTLVVAPSGNDGPAGPSYGSTSGPGGAPAALTVAAADLRRRNPGVQVLLRAGLRVLVDGTQPLGGSLGPDRTLDLGVVTSPRAVVATGGGGLSGYFDRTGHSRVAGRAVLLPRGATSPEAVRDAVSAGAAAVVVDGPLPAGALGLGGRLPVPVLGVRSAVAADVRRQLLADVDVRLGVGPATLEPNPDRSTVAAFSSRGLAFGGGLKPDVAAAGVGLVTSEPGRDEGGVARYGTVSGSSAAAAVTAGAAALLAQARPDLDARGLRAALAAGARPVAGAPEAGAGLVDVTRSAALELVSDPPSVALGAALARGARLRTTVRVRNVSRRPLEIRVRTDRAAAAAGLEVSPARVRVEPGEAARLVVRATVPVLPDPPAVLRGTIRLAARGTTTVRVPWAIAVPVTRRPLVTSVRLTRRSFAPSDRDPAVLSFVAGRVDGTAERPQLLPLERLEIDLVRGERRLGTLARLRNVLPGRYAFGLTGRSPAGRRLRTGSYAVRIVASPVGGGEQAVTIVPFRIR